MLSIRWRTLRREGEPMVTGARPDGVAGLLIDEIRITGIYQSKGYIARVLSNGRIYVLRDGDQLFDGDVIAVGKTEVLFKQVVQDPGSGKPFREVVKTLDPA
jgi:hypothetical protein